MLRTGARLPGAGLVVLALAGALLLVPGAPRAAADGHCWGEDGQGNVIYTCSGGEDGSGGTGGSGGNSGGPPPCDLEKIKGYGGWEESEGGQVSHHCEGEDIACFVNYPSVLHDDEDEEPPGKPSEDAVYAYKGCYDDETLELLYNEYFWYQPGQPSVQELAWQAFGQLQLPDFTLVFNPPQQAVVRLDTWWWAAGAGEGPLEGTSAAGVVAIAEPDHMTIDPGDGSGAFTCPLVTSRSDRCAHVYQRASRGYEATATIEYTVRIEQNGSEIDVPGIPETITTEEQQVTVPVTEVQAVVVD
ncbi:hypothetical protein [Streptomyces sp. YIM 98790]|uniref:hypothetical protein n=1 Tax=Streptomyces sp. YIM 98790 TaxID=2689077 RepID=UPI00140E0503|nr:hypothetical protein [Streptomyces sp. YIM 98790]